MPGWFHGICCCNTEPPPPPPLPCCGGMLCGTANKINNFIVSVAFTPCPPITCSFTVGQPGNSPCPIFGSQTTSSLATTVGTHIVPANPTCLCGATGGCMYVKTTLPFSGLQQGYGGGCMGQPPIGPNHSCSPNPGALLCSNPATPAGDRALAYISVQAQGGLGGGSDGVTIFDATHTLVTSGAVCSTIDQCGTCSIVNSVQIAAFTFSAQEKTTLCAGGAVVRSGNVGNACQAFQPGAQGQCSQLIGNYRPFTGAWSVSVMRG